MYIIIDILCPCIPPYIASLTKTTTNVNVVNGYNGFCALSMLLRSKVALKTFQILGHTFAKPDVVFRLIKTHKLYTLYHAVTVSFAGTRLKERQTDVSNSNSSKSALAEHVCQTSHDIARNDSKIITTNNRCFQRLC